VLAYAGRHRVRGVQRLIDRIYPDRTSNPIQTTIRYDGQFRLKVNTRLWLEWFTFRYGYYESSVHQFLERNVQPNSVVVDVGANIGLHTLTLSRLVGAGGAVIAIEPQPHVRAKLQQTLDVNKVTNVELHAVAVGNTEGAITLGWDDDFETNQGGASLYSAGNAGRVEVPLTTVAKIVGVQTVALIKIDVEGHEFSVLQGAESVIIRDRPLLLFEYSPAWSQVAGTTLDMLKAFFKNLNYQLNALREDGRLDALPPPEQSANIIARPTERIPLST
jgi:FkbM family methyltransferase